MKNKIVMWIQFGNIYTTPEKNYFAAVRDKNQVLLWKGYESFDEVITYMHDYFGCNRNDFIIL